MMSAFLSIVRRSDVNDPVSFARYAHQTIGTKSPNSKEMVLLRKHLNGFFEQTPHATYGTLCTTVEWARGKRRRLAMPWHVLGQVQWAFKDGFLPELDPLNHQASDPFLEQTIEEILAKETDPWWTRAFTAVVGVNNQRTLIDMWREDRGRPAAV